MFNVDEDNLEAGGVSRWFLVLLFLGFVLVAVGVVVVLFAGVFYGGGSVSGAVIFIGPFPIVIGAGPDATLLVLVGVVLAVLSVIVFFVLRRKMKCFGV